MDGDSAEAEVGGKASHRGVHQLVARVVKMMAEVVIMAACLLWVLYWFFSAEPQADETRLSRHVGSRFFRTNGREGFTLIYQTMPLVVVAILSFAVIELRAFTRSKHRLPFTKAQNGLRFSSIKTYPLWVHSPLGVLTVADALFIAGVLFMAFYHFGRINYFIFEDIDNGTATQFGHIVSKSWQKLNYAAYYFGTSAIIPFSLLWIPVSRGSPFLRLIGLPFEHAVRYHIWLSNLMVILVSLHSIGFILLYMGTQQSDLIVKWKTTADQSSIVAGLVAWIMGLIIWITSLSIFRRRWKLVDVLSAKVLESGAIKLHVARRGREGFSYHALSTWCIHIPSISKLQWHFFSAISAPNIENKELIIVIKPLGAWTRKLHKMLETSAGTKFASSSCPFSFKARVEGPYGDESDYYLKYKTLVLIAGGIGVTPILAILQDILHRYKVSQQKSTACLPTYVEVYHCVRTVEELCVLNEINPNKILPSYDELGLCIQIHAYITSKDITNYSDELATHATRGKSHALDLVEFGVMKHKKATIVLPPTPSTNPQVVSGFATMGNTKWVASIAIFSMVGYFVCSGLANIYIVKYISRSFPNYNHAHLIIIFILLGIVIFGGVILIFWSIHVRRNARDSKYLILRPTSNLSSSTTQDSYDNEAIFEDETRCSWNGDLHLCHRPNWNEVFDGLSDKYKGQSVGVLVSGSQSMQEDVASACRRHSKLLLLPLSPNDVAFDFHSISFDF